MAETAGSGGGTRLPSTFGEKLSFAAPVLVATLALGVLIAFVMVWVVGGQIRDDLENAKKKLDDDNKVLRDRMVAAEAVNKDLQAKATDLEKKNSALEKDRDALKADLGVAVKVLEGQKVVLEKVAGDFGKFVEGQKELDITQNKSLTEHDRKIMYIEDKLKRLDVVEKDVLGLQTDTGNLKNEHKVLKADLTKVREKGDITEKDLTELTDRARIFQLRVLAARAKEAAEAARKGDLKDLLNRLSP